MASVRKVGAKWLAEVRVKGSHTSKTFFSKIDAQTWALEQERRLGKHKGKPVAKTLGQALDRYAKEVSPTHKGARWEEIRIEKIKRDTVADIVLADLTADDLQSWIDRQTVSGHSVRREFTLISGTLTTARKKWKWMDHEPQRDVTLPRGNPSRRRRVSEEELTKVLRALEYKEGEVRTIRQQIAAAVLLAVETAMRQGEIWGLEWKHVHLGARYVTLPETKNGTARDVPLSKKAVQLLNSMPKPHEGRVLRVPQPTAQTIFRRACELAGIKDLHFHDLRHEATTRLSKKLKMLELAEMTGHRDPRSLMIYYNPTASELADQLD